MSLPRSLKPAGILEMALVDVILSKQIPADVLATEIATARQTGKFTWSSLNYLAKEQDTVINTPLHPSTKQMRFADTPGALISSNCPQLLELNRLLSEDLKKLKTPQIESKGDEKKRAEPVAVPVPVIAPTIRDQLMVRRYRRRSAAIDRLPTTQASLSDDLPEIKTEDFVDVHFPIADEKQLSEAYSEMKTPNTLEKLFIRFVTHKKHREQADEKRSQFLNLPENSDLKLQYDKELAEEEQWVKQAVIDFENAQKNKEYTGDASKLLKGNDAYQFMLSAYPEGVEGDYKESRAYIYTHILQSKFPNLKLIPEASSQAQPDLRRHRGLGRIQVDTAPALTEISKILNGWLKLGEKNGRLRAADHSRELSWIFDPESFHRFGQNYLRVYAQLPKTAADLERLKHYVEFLNEKMSKASATALRKIVNPVAAPAPAKAAALQPLPVRSLPGVGPVAGDSKSDDSKTVSPPSSETSAAGVSTLGKFAAPAAAPTEAPAKRGGMGARAVHQVRRS